MFGGLIAQGEFCNGDPFLSYKQIWKCPKLCVGFSKCAQLTQPQSFNVLLQLPPAQLENALNKVSAFKALLVAHTGQPSIRSSHPRFSDFKSGTDKLGSNRRCKQFREGRGDRNLKKNRVVLAKQSAAQVSKCNISTPLSFTVH